LTLKAGRILAAELSKRHPHSLAEFTAAAFERVLARRPTPTEIDECVAFLEAQTRRFRNMGLKPGPPSPDGRQPSTNPPQRARENLVHVLFNHHEFVTLR